MRRKTIKASECSKIKMVCGNEDRIRQVIDEGEVKEWVGIGWVTIRKATKADYRKLKKVV